VRQNDSTRLRRSDEDGDGDDVYATIHNQEIEAYTNV
jgi:hypothetical protein